MRNDSNHPNRLAELKQRLITCERLLQLIQTRLQTQPHDKHQLFLQELHQTRYVQLQRLWQEQNLTAHQQGQQLEAMVNDYLQHWEADTDLSAESGPEAESTQRLNHERKTWETLIDKVRKRLVKKPGDPHLMRLLGEHQARLLSIQEQLRQLQGLPAEEQSVFEIYAEQASQVPVSAETQALERELGLLEALCAKTQQRLSTKPELKHLERLIAQHQARMTEIQQQLAALRRGLP